MPIDKDQLGEDTSRETETHVEESNSNRAERIDDRHPRDRVDGREKGRDMRATIKAAMRESAPDAKGEKSPDRAREATGKFAPAEKPEDRGAKVAASPGSKEIPEAQKSSETAQPPATQSPAAVAAPATAPKEVAAIWDKLPQEAQAVFAKREADIQKGVDQLKQKYKPIEDAFAPVRGQLQQLGKTEAEAASQLISWQAALANPRTQAEAFRALAQAHKFDLSTLGSQAPRVADPNSPPDPSQALRPLLDPLSQKVSYLENEFQRQSRERVQGDIASFSQGKPHFEKVKVAMGHLMNSGIAQGSNAKEVFEDAYARACRQDPEVFALVQSEEQAKREADAKASAEAVAKKAAEDAETLRRKQAEEVAKARKAGIGPRGGSPSGMAIAASSKGTSVRDSIAAAIKGSSAAI